MSVKLTPQAEKMFSDLQTEMVKAFGLRDISQLSEGYSVTPNHQQTLHKEMTESSAFLKSISRHLVTELSGEKIGMDIMGFIGKRTDTDAGHDRKAIDPTDLTARQYFCHESEYDLMIKWSKINQWAKFGRKRFYAMWNQLKLEQLALNLMQVGFYGQYEAKETANAGYSADPDKYPRGEDFHTGWIKYFIDWAPEKVWGLNPDGSIKPIKVGPGGDFVNLDQLIAAFVAEVIPTQYQESPHQRALIGKELVNAEYLRIYGSMGDDTSKKPTIKDYINRHEFGQMKSLTVPYFPKRAILITPLNNLAHYEQEGAMERSIEKNKHRKCIEDFTFKNEDFVIENLDVPGMIHPDAIHLPDGNGGWKAINAEDKWEVEVPA